MSRLFVSISNSKLFRERYESAKMQLGKGGAMFEKVIQQLVDLPGWSHLGLICFTEIENREVLKKYLPELTDEELKVEQTNDILDIIFYSFQFILTKAEIEDSENKLFKLLSKFKLKRKQFQKKWLQCLSLEDQAEQKDDSYESLASLLLGSQYVSFRSQEVSSLQDKTYSRLVGGAGSHSQPFTPIPDTVSFQDIKNKPLGDISR